MNKKQNRRKMEEMLTSADEEEPSIDPNKLSYEIFSILETKFLFPPANSAAAVPPSIKTQRGKICILSIDGGGGAGMRGIIPGKALSYLEKALQSKSGDPNARISDYFDLAAGTGIGGFFSAMLFSNLKPFKADDSWRFLADNSSKIYRKSSAFSFAACVFSGGGGGRRRIVEEAMDISMKEVFGDSATLRDTAKPVLIPCYDLRTAAPLVFSRADAVESGSFDFRLWEVCRATMAEPGRFEPVEMVSVDGSTACIGVDGGLAMSNPTAAAITHVIHNKQEFPFVRGVEDLVVVSLGCGAVGAAGIDYRKIRRWGRKEWARPINSIVAGGNADIVDNAVALAFSERRNAGYVRIQANGLSSRRCGADIDCDPSSANVKFLVGVAEEMLNQKNVESIMFGGRRISDQTNMEKLDWIAGELVLEHKRRSCRIAPTVAFKQPFPK